MKNKPHKITLLCENGEKIMDKNLKRAIKAIINRVNYYGITSNEGKCYYDCILILAKQGIVDIGKATVNIT